MKPANTTVLRLLLVLFLSGLESTNETLAEQWPQATAEPWPEADRLFHGDPRWRGGDGSGSFDLGGERILWLFGDSFVSAQPAAHRRETKMVNNTLAIQHGRNPLTASLKYYWKTKDGKPEAFFTTEDSTWLWPASAVMLGDQLLVLLMQIDRADTGMGFRVVDNQGVLVTNPRDAPDCWKLESVKLPDYRFPLIYGSGGLRIVGEYIYSLSPVVSLGHEAYLLRWPIADAKRKDLTRPQWFHQSRWVNDSKIESLPEVTLPAAQTEFTVHRDNKHQALLQVQCSPHLAARIGIRYSKKWQGPWTEIRYLYDPRKAETHKEGFYYYAGKAHPHLECEGLAVTYCSNALSLGDVVNDESIYYPRFLRITLK